VVADDPEDRKGRLKTIAALIGIAPKVEHRTRLPH
jgi:hypothetical protein